MTYRQFMREVKRGQISPVYLFEGEEAYLKRTALQALKKRIISPENEDFNYRHINATQCTGQQILESAYQIPFNSGWQLLVVSEAENLASKDKKQIINYVENPVDTTCMVFVGEKFDGRKKFYRAFKRKGKVVTFRPLREKEATSWIREKVEREGKSISGEAIFQLYEQTGGNLFSLQNEVDKLIAFIHPQTSIKEEHVLILSGMKAQKSIFDLIGSFREQNLSSAVNLLHHLLFQGEQPLIIHTMLVREVRILLRLKLAGSEISCQQACGYIFKPRSNYTGFFLQKAKQYMEAAQRFTLEHLLFAHQRVLSAELAMKKGRENMSTAIEREIVDILTYR